MAVRKLSLVSQAASNASGSSTLDPAIISTLSSVCSEFFHPVRRAELVQKILQAGVQLTHSDRGTVFLATKDGSTYSPDCLTSNIATGLEKGAIQIASNSGIAGDVFTRDRPLIINDAQNDRRFTSAIDASTGYVTNSLLCVPMHSPRGTKLGVIQVLNNKFGQYSESDLQVVQMIALFAAIALDYQDTLSTLDDTEVRLALSKDGRYKTPENYVLQSKNAILNDLYQKLPVFAKSDSSILIEGESGSGKEMIAQVLHQYSDRAKKQFVAINCAAIPESLFEAELFGVAQGAATGTIARKGKIELADHGTLFLDEIGELPLNLQAKLLRVLQERVVNRVGAEGPPVPVDFRILAATNRDLGELVREGRFREDLYYRINVVRFRVPPLRERLEDLQTLSLAIVRRLEGERKLRAKGISPAALKKLESYSWPGNIRQLQNKIESALITSTNSALLEAEDFQLEGVGFGFEARRSPTAAQTQPIEFNLKKAKRAIESELIEKVLRQTRGNKSEAARLLGLSREGLRKALMKIKKI